MPGPLVTSRGASRERHGRRDSRWPARPGRPLSAIGAPMRQVLFNTRRSIARHPTFPEGRLRLKFSRSGKL